MKINDDISLAVLALLLVATGLKKCNDSNVASFAKDAGILNGDLSGGWKQTVRIRPSSSRNILKTVERTVQPADGHDSDGSESSVYINSVPTRAAVYWSRTSGELDYKWYGLSLAPGLSIIRRKEDTGLGVDIRGLYAGDFGAQVGIGLYKKETPTPQVSLGFNLRRTKIFSNVDLTAGIDLNKKVFVGLRTELGNWRK